MRLSDDSNIDNSAKSVRLRSHLSWRKANLKLCERMLTFLLFSLLLFPSEVKGKANGKCNIHTAPAVLYKDFDYESLVVTNHIFQEQ